MSDERAWWEMSFGYAVFIGAWTSLVFVVFGWPHGWDWLFRAIGVAGGIYGYKWWQHRREMRR